MTSESHKELFEQNKDSIEFTPQKRRLASRLARTGIAVLVASGAILGLSACAEAAPEPLKDQYKVGEVVLDPVLAKSRQEVRELCNTGEGSSQTRQDWKDYGYEEETGMSWIDAFTYMGDFAYIDDTAIVDYGHLTYPTIELLSKTCNDAAFLVSQKIHDIAVPATASALLDKFHEPNSGVGDLTSYAVISQTILDNK